MNALAKLITASFSLLRSVKGSEMSHRALELNISSKSSGLGVMYPFREIVIPVVLISFVLGILPWRGDAQIIPRIIPWVSISVVDQGSFRNLDPLHGKYDPVNRWEYPDPHVLKFYAKTDQSTILSFHLNPGRLSSAEAIEPRMSIPSFEVTGRALFPRQYSGRFIAGETFIQELSRRHLNQLHRRVSYNMDTQHSNA